MQASSQSSIALRKRNWSLFGEFWIYVGLCAFFALIFVQYAAKIRGSDRPDTQSAVLRWTPVVRQIPEVNIWKTTNWPNSPIMAMILKPFMDVDPPLLGSEYWLLAKLVMTLLSVWLVFRMLDRPETPFPLWGKALAVLMTLRPIEGDLVHGNINLFILLTVVSCLYAYRRGWDVMAGLSLALGIACKITPALFLPYFVWKRSWTALAASAVGLVLYLVVSPGLYFGWQQNLDNLTGWYDGMIRPFVEKYEVTSEHPNQSLPGLLERMLRHRPSSTVWDENQQVFVPTEFHNFVDLPRPVVSGITKGALLLFTLATVLWMRRSKFDRTDWRWGAEFAVIVLGMLLFSERTWKHHAVVLLVPFAVLCHQGSGFRLTPAEPTRLLRRPRGGGRVDADDEQQLGQGRGPRFVRPTRTRLWGVHLVVPDPAGDDVLALRYALRRADGESGRRRRLVRPARLRKKRTALSEARRRRQRRWTNRRRGRNWTAHRGGCSASWLRRRRRRRTPIR